MHRRRFLADGLRTSALVALSPSVPGFLAKTVRGAEPDRHGRVLVVIEMGGGNDGINTVVPYKDEGYVRHRPTLRLPVNRLLKLTDGLALNPAMRGMAKLLEGGSLAIVQGVAYPNPNRSHFESMAIWHTGQVGTEARGSLGWIGRGLDGGQPPDDGAASAMSIGDAALSVALRGRRTVASSLDKIATFRLADGQNRPNLAMQSSDELAAFAGRSMLDAYATADRLAALAPDERKDVSYPESALAGRLRIIARLIRGGMGTRVYYTSQPGYDTHTSQSATHATLLETLSSALSAFQADLAAAGVAERVVVMTFSEFGRRVAENGSRGTDHGTAGPIFIAGPRVKPGFVGTAPSLIDLEDGDLKWSIDFRRIYATVLEDWLGLNSREALGREFERLPLLKA